jgi:GNAT superfamily N-acetyltransferase
VTQGRWALFLQLLFVVPEARGRGVPEARGRGASRALMGALARFTRDQGYARLDWNAVPGNAPATGLYASLGVPVFDRLYYRLAGDRLAEAARTWPEPIR